MSYIPIMRFVPGERLVAADYERMKRWFEGYIESLGPWDPDIRGNVELKRVHTYNVVRETEGLARDLGLVEGELARVIALVHDVGRFKQLADYGTFSDSRSVDHGDLGADILKGVVEDETVLKAVIYHNKLGIPPGLSKRELFFLKIIRDADKLDIWRVVTEFYESGEENRMLVLGLPSEGGVRPEVVDEVRSGKMVLLEGVRNVDEMKVLQMSWAYDLNFSWTRKEVRRRRYIERLAAVIGDREAAEECLSLILPVLEE